MITKVIRFMKFVFYIYIYTNLRFVSYIGPYSMYDYR